MTAPTRRGFLAAAAGTLAAAGSPAVAAEPIRRAGKPRMRLGLAAYSYRDHLTGRAEPRMTLLEFVDAVAEMDCDAVELTEYYFRKPVTAAEVTALKRRCYLNGLDISGAPMRTTLTHPAGPERDRELAAVRAWVDWCALLGAPTIRVFAGDVRPDQTPEEAARCCIEALEEACAYAGEKGILLALENHGGIVAEPTGLLAIIKGVRSDWCGVNLDSGNFHTADPYADVALCAPYAVTAQVKTEVQRRGGPKEPADLPRIIGILRDTGYRGYVTLEYEAAEPALQAVPRTLRELRALL